MTLVVGVDAGASHTEALLAVGGTAVARHSGGPGILAPGKIDDAARLITGLVTGLLRQAGGGQTLRALVVGAAGAGRESNRLGLETALRAAGVAPLVQVTTDGHVALQSAFGDDPGILLTAGTGSLAMARDPKGGLRRAGGHGWRFGDEGSGYALARSGLSAAARAADGRGPPTTLAHALPQAAGSADVAALLEWARAADGATIAGLATAVLQACDAGDAVAQDLVTAAGRDLAAHVHALLAFFPPGRGAPVALSGSLLLQGSAVRGALLTALEPDSDRILVTTTMVDPAAGAVALAARLTG